MVTFELVSDQEVTINGVGLLEPGKPKQVDDVMLKVFAVEHGYPLSEANFPSFVRLTAVLAEDETDEKREEV